MNIVFRESDGALPSTLKYYTKKKLVKPNIDDNDTD